MATTEATPAKKTNAAPKAAGDLALKRALKRRMKKEGNKKLDLKLATDKEFAKTFFEARSKRAADKKSAFRKKKSKKK